MQARTYYCGASRFRSAAEHHQRASGEQGQAQGRPAVQPLVEDQAGKRHRHQDAQPVDGHHHAGGPVLEGPVVAQPGGPGRQPRQADKAQLSPGHRLEVRPLPGYEDHDPRHDQHHAGADRRAQIGVHAADAHLAQDGCEAGKHGGAHGPGQPKAVLLPRFPLRLLLDHQIGPRPHAENAQGLINADGFPQQDECQKDRQHRAALVHGGHFVDVPQLQSPEIAQPGGSGGQPGQDQKQQRPPPCGPQSGLGSGEEDHQPGEHQYHDRADGRGHGGVRPADAAFG